jgi:hypothetical protein
MHLFLNFGKNKQIEKLPINLLQLSLNNVHSWRRNQTIRKTSLYVEQMRSFNLLIKM